MSIAIEQLRKSFGSQQVLDSISESFAQGCISVLLGASGCGKTTTLRCIAGLERPTGGRIVIDECTVYQESPPVWVPPERRRVAMVFQSYAIWPHMTVFENVALPLVAAGMGKPAIRRAVLETLHMVGLDSYAGRSVTELSGGQQQRVALSRCIVSESPVILMDEPLSNLDARLRIAMRGEIRELQRRLKRTIVFVTHDQEEAMSIADTVYLYRDGRVIQKGAPKDIYDNPASRYAAEFLGRANILSNYEWAEGPLGAAYRLAGGACLPAAAGGPPAQGAMLCIRPEKWRFVNPERAAIAGRIASTSFIGDRTEYWIDTAFGQIAAVELNAAVRRPGEAVGLEVAAHDIRIIGE